MTSPTQLSLEKLRRDGWECDVVERWIPGANIRRDFLGAIDIIAVHDASKWLWPIRGIQATTEKQAAAHVRKLLKENRLKKWLMSGAVCEVWSWRKEKGRWRVIIRPIKLACGVLVADKPPRKKRERKLF